VQTYKPEWAVMVEDFIYDGHSYPVQSPAVISRGSWDFELPYPIFNRVTNYIIHKNPAFVRNDDYMVYDTCECPHDTLPDVGFVLQGATAGDDITVTVTSHEYATYDSDSNTCLVLFRPSSDKTGSFGLSLLEQNIVTFDYTHQKIGFTARDVQTQ